MKILMVSPYPPARDGVANYAAQVAAGLRAQGHRVAVVSPTPSAAAHHQPLQTIRGTWRAARLGRRADKTIVQFQPEAFFSGMRLDLFVRHWIGLMVLFSAGGNVEVVVHEAPYSDGGRAGAVRERMWRRLWQQPAALAVHTEAERDELVANLGVKEGNIKLIGHGDHFTRRSTASKADAREELGIDPEAFVFLSIGFLQPHKGFDRTARGLARLDGANLRLDIVGEVRVRTPEHDRYIRMLEDLAAADPRVHLHREYVSDEQFDAWIIAADALVLPYREIWSSGVVERAALYDRPVVVTDVGGLPGQVDGALVARDAGELVEA
ncbi:MAG: glycosyltransferase family 4 protein, partial [Acidimicrobiales bacterium]